MYEVGLVFPLGRHRWLSIAFADHSTKIQTSSSMPMAQTVHDSTRTESDVHTKGSGGGQAQSNLQTEFHGNGYLVEGELIARPGRNSAILVSFYAIQRIVFRISQF